MMYCTAIACHACSRIVMLARGALRTPPLCMPLAACTAALTSRATGASTAPCLVAPGVPSGWSAG
eukprot:5911860-Lingulodinium_polyedra.AAC.1